MKSIVTWTGAWTLDIVKRSDMRGSAVVPKRGIIEPTLGWTRRNRRLMRDY